MSVYWHPRPVAVIAKMLGNPEKDDDIFRDFTHRILGEGPDHSEISAGAASDLLGCLYENLKAHKEERRSDLIEYLLATEVGGRQLEEWLKGIPEFRLADPHAIARSVGQVREPLVIPVAFG